MEQYTKLVITCALIGIFFAGPPYQVMAQTRWLSCSWSSRNMPVSRNGLFPEKYPPWLYSTCKKYSGGWYKLSRGIWCGHPPVKKVSPSFPLLLLLPLLLNARIEYTTTRLLSNAQIHITCIKRQKRSRKVFTLKISHSNFNYKSMKTTTTIKLSMKRR